MNDRTFALLERLDNGLWRLSSEIHFVEKILGLVPPREMLEIDTQDMAVIAQQIERQLVYMRNVVRQLHKV